MVNLKQYFFLILLFAGHIACKGPKNKDAQPAGPPNLVKDTSLLYARRFSIATNESFKVVYLFGNRDNIHDTTAVFIIARNPASATLQIPRSVTLKNHCKRIASLSSIYTNMLCELGETEHIAAIENIDYYNNPLVVKKFGSGGLAELSKGPQPDVEKTIALNPDIIFTFGMGHPEKEGNPKISKAGIPLVTIVDHLEESPLARAEWIKFFAAFTGKEKVADSIFNETEKKYKELKKIAGTSPSLPTVFSEIKLGEIWYVPGGKSFAATLFQDASALYVWKDNDETGSLHLSFEEVYTRAKDADFWLNMALVGSKKELLVQENRYAEFKAFKTGHLYNNIKNVNALGYSDYWETGILHPDRILSDLISIFHPDLKPRLKNDLYYYKKLE